MRILFISTKQPSVNPRLSKAATTLAKEGNTVHVLYAFSTKWALKEDERLFKEVIWTQELIGGEPVTQGFRYSYHRLIKRILIAITGNPHKFCHAFPVFVRKSRNWNPDIIIGHNPGTLWLIHYLKLRLNKKVHFDAEDYHSGEVDLNARESQSISFLEERVLSKIDSITAASPLIAQYYRNRFPNTPIETIDNAFPKSLQPKPPKPITSNQPITIVWFSQVVGLDRGLKEFLQGLRYCPNISIRLDIVGRCSIEVESHLRNEIHSTIHEIDFFPLMNEERLFEFISNHEIGLALETGVTLNRDICRTNKLFAYAMCGCYTLFSKTSAQVNFVQTYPEVGRLVSLDDPQDIASGIEFIAKNRALVFQKRLSTWKLSNETLNWELEGRKLLNFINSNQKKSLR